MLLNVYVSRMYSFFMSLSGFEFHFSQNHRKWVMLEEITESNLLAEAASSGACYSGFLISVDLNCYRTMAWSLLTGLLLRKGWQVLLESL